MISVTNDYHRYANNLSDTDTNQGLGNMGKVQEQELADGHKQRTMMDGEQQMLNGRWGVSPNTTSGCRQR